MAANEDPKVDRVDIWIANHKHKDGSVVNKETANKIVCYVNLINGGVDCITYG